MSVYNPNASLNLPGPLSGSAGAAAYGSVPSPVAMPPDLLTQSEKAVPGISGLTGDISSLLESWARGNLSPDTENTIQDYASSRGISSGIPGMGTGNMFANLAAKDIGLTAEGLESQAASDFPGYLSSIESGMTPQALTLQNETRTSDLAAAPNPTAAANRLLQVYNAYMQSANSAASGTGGYSIAPSPLQASNPFSSGGTGTYSGSIPYYGQGNYGQLTASGSPYQVYSTSGTMPPNAAPIDFGGVGSSYGYSDNPDASSQYAGYLAQFPNYNAE